MTAATTAPTKPSNVVSGDTFRSHQTRVRARRDERILEHQHLVRSIAESVHRSLPPSFELDDLISLGNIGLLKAATRFRPRLNKGVPFAAYARMIIRGEILEGVRRRHYTESTRPSIDDCAEPAVENVIDISIDRERHLARVRDAMLYLTPRKQAVMRTYYGSPGMRFSDVAEQLEMSRTVVGELHAEAVNELRRILHVR